MIKFPGSKINLSLAITGKQANGFHTIESVFIPINLSDILEIIPINKNEKPDFNYSGLAIPGMTENNLIFKAFKILSDRYNLAAIKVELHKIVPMGAGLGGGSADASAMLLILNQLFDLKIGYDELAKLAAALGADCPFFIHNKPSYVTGIGEKINSINLDLSGKFLMVIYPQIHINTREAFANIKIRKTAGDLLNILDTIPINKWKNHIFNDFEPYVFSVFPEIAEIKSELYRAGADYASLSGSGSAVYAFFENEITIPEKLKPYFVYTQFL